MTNVFGIPVTQFIPEGIKCDLCNNLAKYDANIGIAWANVCQSHFNAFGCKLGTGYGQILKSTTSETSSIPDKHNECIYCGTDIGNETECGECQQLADDMGVEI